jgi:biopolymer transport protein ExbB/TolQ
MSTWALVSVVLIILVVILIYRLNKRNKEYVSLEKQEERAWALKVALEKTYDLPTVEADEVAKIEAEIERIMSESGSDEETEENMRRAIMTLYEKKQAGG